MPMPPCVRPLFQYATTRAKENGYTEEAEDWANMGQGAPEWYDGKACHPKLGHGKRTLVAAYAKPPPTLQIH